MMRGTVAGLGACCVAIAIGCGGPAVIPAGSERGLCYPNGGCDLGLTCASGLCVLVETDAGGRGGSNAGAGGGGGGDSGTGGATGAAGTFAVAPHPAQPQIANLGGPVLNAPKLRPIFFPGDPNRLEVEQFLQGVGTGSYWRATTSEYGVGPITVLPAVVSTSTASSISDNTLQVEIASSTASASAPWGAADPNTIYLFMIPPSVTLTFSTEVCCTSFGGYHIETIVNGMAVPYVAACSCPGLIGTGWSIVDDRTAAISHELIEAATDPFPDSNPAYTGANQTNVVWTMVTGGELTDMCVIQPDAYGYLAGSGWAVAKSWSNAAAARGDDPCVPGPTSIPYFNSPPALDLIPFDYTGTYKTRGLAIPIGTSRTIDLDLFSTGVVPHDWDVNVYSYEDFFGGTHSLNLSLDRTSGRNGDILRLTITSLRTNPILGVSPFVVLSTYGATGQADFRSHVAMGLVMTQ